jgi:protein ImuB
MAAPRAPLVRRFGREIVLRLDQAIGLIDEALSPRLPVPELSAERRLAEPIMTVEDVERVVLTLAGALGEALERRGAGALALRLFLFRVDGLVARLPSACRGRRARRTGWRSSSMNGSPRSATVSTPAAASTLSG